MAIPSDNILFRTTVLGHILTEGEIDIFVVGSMGWFDGIPGKDPIEEIGIITDHVERAQKLLIEQFENSPNLNTLLEIYVNQLQQLEYAIDEVIKSRNLETAIGDALDIIGERVGEDRNFKNDTDYRAAIYFKIFLNSSNGEPETIIEAIRILGQATHISYTEPFPATVMIQYQSLSLPPANLKQQIEQIAPSGVKIFIGFVNTNNPVFAFDGEGGFPAAPNTAGFNELNEDVGGVFMELLS